MCKTSCSTWMCYIVLQLCPFIPGCLLCHLWAHPCTHLKIHFGCHVLQKASFSPGWAKSPSSMFPKHSLRTNCVTASSTLIQNYLFLCSSTHWNATSWKLLFLVALGFKLRAMHLLSRHCKTWAMHPALESTLLKNILSSYQYAVWHTVDSHMLAY
jgi:hypothetical protein